MDNTRKHIRILGAGPSGMTAAVNLKKHGFDVTVYEQKSVPGARFSNGWQILENYSSTVDALEEVRAMNIQPDFAHTACREIDCFDSKLRGFHFSGTLPYGYFVRRGSQADTLDSALHRQAIDAGVTIAYNTTVKPADADIISNGSRYAAGISKEIVFDSQSKDIFITILDDYLTPSGFSYLFIINGRGTVGAAILRDFKNINRYAESVVLRFRQLVSFDMVNVKESVSSVGFFLPATGIQDNKIYIGEAAGFQDYLFGLGIRRSMQSGYLAAKSIIDNTGYDALWKAHFGKMLKAGIVNRFLFEKLGNPGYALFLKCAQRFDFRKLGYRLQNPSPVRLIAAALLRQFWLGNKPCRHGSRCTWCRTH